MRKISPYRNSPRNHKIDTITIHCVVGQASVEGLCGLFQTSGASCNYGIGADGRICTIVDEADRSWCSSSPGNDNRAITIECASDAFHPYAINANVWEALVELCVDICKRNNIKRLLWQADKGLVGQIDLQNMTAHRWFENKSCPGDYIYSRLGQIAKEVNAKLAGASAEPFKPYQGQVNADDGLNCRTAPVSGKVLKTYPDGTVLTITKQDGGWGYTGEGWVCLEYVNKIASAKDPAAKEEIIMDGKAFGNVDAFVIADKLRLGRVTKEVYMDDYRYKALQTLTRARFYAVQDLTREKQRFANYLFLKCSGLAQDKDIVNTSATTIALMERFEIVDELAYADLDDLTAFVNQSGHGRFHCYHAGFGEANQSPGQTN